MIVNLVLKCSNLKRIQLARCFSLSSKKCTGQQNEFLKNYTNLVENKLLRVDEHQLKTVQFLNQFYNKILTYEMKPCQTASTPTPISLFNLFKQKKKLPDVIVPNLKGVYLYGGVGQTSPFTIYSKLK